MTGLTALDGAWLAAEAPDAGDAEMARFYEVLAGAEVHMPIEPESLEGAGPPQPLIFPLESGETALIFDTQTRLAAFMEGGAAHLTLSGRAVIEMFAGRGVGVGVNLGDAPSATILPPSAIDWAAAALNQPIEANEAREMVLTAPRAATPDLLQRLDARLAAMGGLVKEAWLCGAGPAGRGGLVVLLVLSRPEAERGAVAALAETARFAGGDRPAFDIAVIADGDPRLARARKIGLGFGPEDPEARAAREAAVRASEPPKLR